ncbi:peptidase [Streptomyces nojiriensis]|uniref:Peptidase n=1 Tax=Streptomyces nojiriensis TaxID=66374 RepID=A0ABQ3SKS8_9ACTN|nr:alpha/beta hydrolase [Streptomyces nojiriensis]QTI50316.1 Carboxylesterase A [Streptomyces nojiriensis]GGS29941.1 peptidase [Streptomyces nojiriensis]GHI68738.1 peptidase [Streptomyces nojiriensis]
MTRLADDPRRRVVWGISLVLIAVTALLGGAPGTAGAAGAPPVPVLSWGPCDGAADGFECATARVPVDHRRPAGPTLALAVTRRAAADPAHRTGVLVLHPGGPGNSGVNFARSSYEALPAALRDAFDVVGYDMRGVARSGQVECWDDKEYAAAVDGARGVPGSGALREAVRQGADFAAACRERSGELMPFIGTASNAGDLDLLRQALGEETLSFYGRSFGSYVGTVYAARFPARVRAMVLDGAYDPRRYADVPYAYDAAQFAALDAAVGRFLDWCGRNAAACGFGEGRPRQAFEQLKRDLDADPVITASGRPATGYTLAYRLMFNINAGKEIWPYLGQALRSAQARQASFLLSPPSPASFDFLSANVAVECADRLYPGSGTLLGALVGAEASSAPLLGPPIGLGPPTYDHNHAPACTQWPAERPSRYEGSYRAAGSAPILVLGTTGDPDTPYNDAVTLARTLDGGRLLTFDAEGHTAYHRSACVSALVDDYLTTLSLPAGGTVCADEAPPEPFGRRTAVSEVDETRDVIPTLR